MPVDLPGAYLVLDLGNRCPLACKHCIQSEPERHEHFQRRNQMDPELAFGLLDELRDRGRRFHALILFWLGEPLTHPRFAAVYERALEVARSGVFHRVEVHTNAVLLEPEISRRVCGLTGVEQRWHFSLDAALPATYARVKGRDHYRAVRRNVMGFLDERAAADNDDLGVVFQFIPQTDNAREARPFVTTWRHAVRRHGRTLSVVARVVPEGGGDHVFFRQLDALDPGQQAEADRLYQRVLWSTGVDPTPPALRRATAAARDALSRRTAALGGRPSLDIGAARPVTCACPFLSSVVHHDGRVTVCTRDSSMSLCVGDLRDSSYHAIWWESAGLRALRDAHLRGDAGGLCRDCPIPRSANYTGLAADDLQRLLAATDQAGLQRPR